MAKHFLVLLSSFFLYISNVSCQTYKAAVVEYNPTIEDTPTNTLLRNAELYLGIISTAKESGANIVVFPEYGLTGKSNVDQNLEEYSTFVPEPSYYAIPCESRNYSKALTDLSCGIAEKSIYVVVNLIEKAVNSTNGTIYFNTNVVFNPSGVIVAKYRKINPYDEAYLTPGNETVTFTTDFGVTFGVLTSYDILYKSPAIDLLSNNTVTDVVYPSLWYSESPFGVSLSIQASYSRANRVNLLASGYNDAISGVTGSGVYYYNGTSPETFIVSVRTTKTIIQDVPIFSRQAIPECEDQILSRGLGGIIGVTPDISNLKVESENLQNYTFSGIDLTNTRQINETVCSGINCCTFEITLETNTTTNSYSYKLAVFNGVRQLGNLTLGTRTCAVVACTSEDTNSCGAIDQFLGANTTFQSIRISGTFSKSFQAFHGPLSLQTNFQPLYRNDFSYCLLDSADNSSVSVSVTSKRALSGVLAFGIGGRVYDIDNRDAGQTDSGSSLSGSVAMLVLLIVVNYLIKG